MEVWRFTPEGKFFCHKLEHLDHTADILCIPDAEPWYVFMFSCFHVFMFLPHSMGRLKYDCLGISLLPTVYMGYYNTNGRSVNVLATRILVDRDLFEIRSSIKAYSLWHQAVCGDVLFYRVDDNNKLVNYKWEYLCHDFVFFFREGDLLPYNLLEKHAYTVTKTPTQDWTSVLNGDVDRTQELYDICNNNSEPTKGYPATAQDKVLGCILAVLLRRMEPETWNRNSMRELFG